MEQALLCLVGLLLAGFMTFAVHRTNFTGIIGPLGYYLGGHLAACIVGSLIFAISVTKKNVLNLLQEKE